MGDRLPRRSSGYWRRHGSLGLAYGLSLASRVWGQRNLQRSRNRWTRPHRAPADPRGPDHRLGLRQESALTWIAWALTTIVAVIPFKTPVGLGLRGVGEQSEAAETFGVDVARYRIAAVILAGALTCRREACARRGQRFRLCRNTRRVDLDPSTEGAAEPGSQLAGLRNAFAKCICNRGRERNNKEHASIFNYPSGARAKSKNCA